MFSYATDMVMCIVDFIYRIHSVYWVSLQNQWFNWCSVVVFIVLKVSQTVLIIITAFKIVTHP